MSDLKLLASLREFDGSDIAEYLNKHHRQNIKAIEDAFRRTKNNSDALTSSLASLGSTVAERNYGVSDSSSTFSTSSTSLVDVTNMSVTITTNGNPVMCFIEGTEDDSSVGSYVRFSGAGVNNAIIAILRDSTPIYYGNIDISASDNIIPPMLFKFDVPAAGTYTYKVQAKVVVSGTCYIYNCKLLVLQW